MTVSVVSVGTAIVSTVSVSVVGFSFSFSFGFSVSRSFAEVTVSVSAVVSGVISVSMISVSTVSVVSTVGLRLGLSKSTCQSGEKGYGKQGLHGRNVLRITHRS